MLLSFEVENFRSVKEAVTLNMTAVNYYKESSDQLIDMELPGLSGIRFLRAAAVYGPNASGKTSLWRALKLMRDMVLEPPAPPAGAQLPHTPFMLDAESRRKPTAFSIAFAAKDGVRYEYSFAYDRKAIIREELAAYPKGLRRTWFRRSTENGETAIRGSGHFKIPAAAKPLLNDNALLLPLIANYRKIESSEKAARVVSWFADDLNVYCARNALDDFPLTGEIVCGAQGTDYQRSFIQNMLRRADVGISRADVERRQMPPMPEEIRVALEALGVAEPGGDTDYKAVVFRHEGRDGAMSLDLSDESDGTRQLFGLSGHVAKTLERGSVLFVDELDSSLHPILAVEVVRSFLDLRSNPRNAQLVFTAHNPCLLEHDLLRRDQIWFTEKDASGATNLYPLSDYSPRKDETISSGYLTGRYSAIPVVPECFGRCCDREEG